MNTPSHPLMGTTPGDTIDAARDLIAVLMAATHVQDECRSVRFAAGEHLLLTMIEDALEHLARQHGQGG